jgi:hypothetical protein
MSHDGHRRSVYQVPADSHGFRRSPHAPGDIVLCGVAMIVVNRKLHAAFVVGSLVYEASWILRLFRTLT